MGIRIAAKPIGPSTRSTTTSVALLAGSQALGILTTPGPKKGSFDEAFANEASEVKPCPKSYGTNRIKPNLRWYGDQEAIKVKNDGLFLSVLEEAGVDALLGYAAGGGTFGIAPTPPSAYLGLIEGGAAGMLLAGLSSIRAYSWRYSSGWAYNFGWGPIDAVTELLWDEHIAYTGADNAGSTITINDPNAWGGVHVDGGLYFVADIIAGDLWPIQQPNPYLKSILGGHVPAFDGKAGIVLRGHTGAEDSGYFAAGVQGNPLVRPFSATILSLPNLLGVPEFKAINSGKDANIIEVIYDWSTARARGYGYGGKLAPEKFNLTNLRAGAETIFNEGLGYSAELTDNQKVGDHLDDMLQFASAAVFENPRTGEIKINLIRRDYSIPSLKVFDETNITSVKGFSQDSNSTTPNEVHVLFTDRDNNYKPRDIPAQNDATQLMADNTLSRTVNFPGIGCQPTAKIIAGRELSASFPRPPVTLEVKGLSADDVEYGEVVVWRYPKYRIEQRILRVFGIEQSSTESNAVELTCAEDVFGTGDALNVVIGETLWRPGFFQFNDLKLKLPSIELALTGYVDAVNGVLNIEIPAVDLALVAEAATIGTLALVIPAINLALSGIVSATGEIITEDEQDIITEDGDRIVQEG